MNWRNINQDDYQSCIEDIKQNLNVQEASDSNHKKNVLKKAFEDVFNFYNEGTNPISTQNWKSTAWIA